MGSQFTSACSFASVTLACLLSTAACSSDDRGVIQPTSPTPAPPSVVQLIHYSLQPPENRTPHSLRLSYLRNSAGCLAPCAPDVRAFDDFTSATATMIRRVSWQGGYCRSVIFPLPGFGGRPAPPPPVAVARSFEIRFYADRNGNPRYDLNSELYKVRLMPSELREQLPFANSFSPDGTCVPTTLNGTPTATYYDYTAVLAIPFAVTAGTRYWLSVQADTGLGVFPQPADTPDIQWGWRMGLPNDNRSGVAGLSGFTFLPTTGDLAFSLSPE
jgi:hypothetical protein